MRQIFLLTILAFVVSACSTYSIAAPVDDVTAAPLGEPE